MTVRDKGKEGSNVTSNDLKIPDSGAKRRGVKLI